MIEVTASLLVESNFNEYETLLLNTRYRLNLYPVWLATYRELFNLGGKELILESRDLDDGKLLGFLPLFRRDDQPTRFFNHRQLLPLGYRPTDFFDIVSSPNNHAEIAQSIAKWLRFNRRIWDQLRLNLIPCDSPSWIYFTKSLKEEGFNPIVTQEQAYFKLDTTVSYDGYLQTMGTQKQKELRYYQNKLSKEGTLEFEHIERDCPAYFDEFANIYADRRNAQNQSNPFTRSYMPQYEFMKKIVAEYAKRDLVRLSILKLNKNPIAYAYHFIDNHVDYYSMPAFLDDYKTYAPGKILLNELIRIAFEDPDIHEFNFMRYEASYKLWFNPQREKYVSITVDNPWSWRNKALPVLQYLSKLKQSLT